MSINLSGIEFSDEAIEAMKNGETIGGVLSESSQHFKPSSSIPISGYDRGVKPRVRDKEGVW